jgi:Flp pilus assembly protein TadD
MSKLRLVCHGSARILAAAAVVSLAGCGSAHLPTDGLQSLSGLPHKDQAMMKVADASRDAGDCVAAIRFYRLAASQSDKKDEIAAARIGAAGCEFASGAPSEAEHDYRAAIAEAPEDPAAYVGLGRIFLVQHHPEQAFAYFSLALKKGGTSAILWNDRGVALDQLRRHREAQQDYRAGIAAYSSDRALRNNLALSLAMTRDFGEAEKLMRGLASEPNATSRTRENLALVLGLAGDDLGAREASRGDLDEAALDNNRRFYDYARTLIPGAAKAAQTNDVPAAAPAAHIAALPLPPAVAANKPVPAGKAAAPRPASARAAAMPAPRHDRRTAHRTPERKGSRDRHVADRRHRNRLLHRAHASATHLHRHLDGKARAAGTAMPRQTARRHAGQVASASRLN